MTFYFSNAQAQRFGAGFVAGGVVSQMDGDGHTGYQKPGFEVGLRGDIIFTNRLNLTMELLYNQRGANGRNSSGQRPKPPVEIGLQYVSVPVLFDIKFAEDWDGIFRWSFQTGVSYDYLIDSDIWESGINFTSIENSNFRKLEPFFNDSSLSFTIGFSYHFTPNIYTSIRHSFAITPLYTVGSNPESTNGSLRPYFIALRMGYLL